jgi:AraC family transcriptional regulator
MRSPNLLLESLGLELAGRAAPYATTLGADLDTTFDKQQPRWLLRAREFLRETNPPPKIGEAAAVAGVHPVHLARAFRRHFHSSPGEYLRECRLERAKALLADARRTLADVAFAAGFCDQSELTHAFRRTYGWTPRQFRRLLQR